MQKPFEFEEATYFDQLFTKDIKLSNEHINFQKVIAFGAFGVVIQATLNNGNDVAIKVIEKNKITSGDIKCLQDEALILSSLDHPNIVKFQKFLETTSHILIVMDLIKDGTLKKFIDKRQNSQFPIKEDEASEIMKQILQAVQFLHSNNIVHRDLKLDNILIDDFSDLSTIKIADFGLSKSFHNKKMNLLSSKCGTLIYMAPEILTKQKYGKVIKILWLLIQLFSLAN